MRKMGLNKNYVVGIYNDNSFSTHISKPEKLKELLLVDMGDPLHSLVIPGKMHELEQNAVDYLKIE